MTRYVQPAWLFAESTQLNWAALTKGTGAQVSLDAPTMLMLRWALNKDLGLPAVPFTVWERTGDTPMVSVPLPGGSLTVFANSPRDIAMAVQAARVSLVVDTPSAPMTLDAFSSGGSRITGVTVNQGASGQSVTLTGTGIARVRVSGSGRVDSVTLVPAAEYANLPDWHPLEIVGLPVDTGAAPPYSTAQQGMTSAPTTPEGAALQRLKRAGPSAGWPVPGGFTVPSWTAPDYSALITAYQQTIVADLIGMLAAVADPTQHGAYRTTTSLPQPQDQLGDGSASSTALGDSSASVPPLGLLALACHGDIYAALALGYATGYPVARPPVTYRPPPVDYMVTVEHKFAVDLGPISIPFSGELAAFFAPAGASRPLAPAGLQATAGPPRPAGRDRPRVCAVAVSWNRTDTLAGSMAAVSAAVARALPSGSPRLLVNLRATDAPVPFVAALPTNAAGDQLTRTTFTDGVFPDLAEPTGTYSYLVCGQNRWGVWSDWSQTALAPPAEAPQQPLLVGVGLELVDPAGTGTARSAVLTVDISWDWHDRSPGSVDIVAAYVTATPSAAPTAQVFDPLGAATPLRLEWTVVAGTAQDPPAASLGGATVVRSEPALGSGDTTPPDEVGRYRVTVPVTLDFSAGTDVSLACWIRGTEYVTGLVSDWTPPRTATVHNPVPPPAPGPPDPLTWTSLADATGHSRAHLSWSAVTGATGYVVYHADESALLSAAGEPPPDLDQPLSARKTALDGAVRIENVRDAFLRVTPDPVSGTSYDLELPRGSQLLHGFVVLARSPAGVESPWPTTPPVEVGGRGYTLMGIPRPRVPQAPGLAVTAGSGSSVGVRVSADPAQIERIDIHRTALARLSGDVGTMGPPIATLFPAGDDWPDHVDSVAPSWRPYWYRAVAWGAHDDANGWRSSPGPASAVRSVLLPPTTPPTVSGGTIVPAAGGDPSYLVFTTDAPPIATGLGRFIVRVAVTTTDGTGTPAQFVLNTTLDAVPAGSAVPAAGADPVGPAWLAPDGSIGVVLNPPAGSAVVSARISVTDPRGQSQPSPTEVLP